MDTQFASPARSSREIIQKEFQNIKDVDFIGKVLDSLPFIVTILNTNRQIVYSNNVILELLGVTSLDSILGLRPGEAIQCNYSKLEEGGCGTSEHCKVCGAVKSILECQQTNKTVSYECRIANNVDGKMMNFDLMVTSSPFYVNGRKFTMLSMNDISSEKRRKLLERMFYHDILNITGSLRGFVSLLEGVEDPDEIKNYVKNIEFLTDRLSDDIMAQRQLSQAENNELPITIEETDSNSILNMAILQCKYHDVAEGKNIIIEKCDESNIIKTDIGLLQRVLLNMMKNALEAINAGETITLSYKCTPNYTTFFVHNQGYIPYLNQLQIFQRSFSTKGVGRGIGTYSIKLLGETYLKGMVGFSSTDEKGTTFYIKIPLIID